MSVSMPPGTVPQPLEPLFTPVGVTPDVLFDSNNEQVDTFRVSFTVGSIGTFDVQVPQKDATLESIDAAIMERATLIASVMNLAGPLVAFNSDGTIDAASVDNVGTT